MAQLKFNAAEVDTTSRDAIPSGTYEAVVTDSETRATKNGNGMGINLTFEILSEGPAKGRKVFAWINYENASAKAQQIGREELASLFKAVGVTDLDDTVQLHNLPLLITVSQLLVLGHQGIHVISVAQIGRNPARRSMRLKYIPHLLKICHLIPDRRRTQIQCRIFRDRPRADRFTGLQIVLNDRF